MKLSLLKSLAFQIFLYKGSHVPHKNYSPLLESLQRRLCDLNVTISEKSYSFFQRNEFTNDTIAIGHSFGGYFALLDSLQDQNRHKNIKGIVLVNSHFNSKKRAWYPGIAQKKLSTPVLTIVGGQDTRLPLKKVLPDLWEKMEDRISNKFYKIYPDFDHFSGLSGVWSENTEILAQDIELFVRSVHRNQFTEVAHDCGSSEHAFSYNDLASKIPRSIDFNHSLNFLDALYKIFLKRFFWEWIHNILFLLETPTVHKNVVFTDYGDHILIKSYNLPLEQVLRFCNESLPSIYKTEFEILKVPTNVWGLYQWLLYPLALHVRVEDNTTVRWPILCLPVKPNVTYYKILHPRQILYKQIDVLSSSKR